MKKEILKEAIKAVLLNEKSISVPVFGPASKLNKDYVIYKNKGNLGKNWTPDSFLDLVKKTISLYGKKDNFDIASNIVDPHKFSNLYSFFEEVCKGEVGIHKKAVSMVSFLTTKMHFAANEKNAVCVICCYSTKTDKNCAEMYIIDQIKSDPENEYAAYRGLDLFTDKVEGWVEIKNNITSY